MNDTFAVRVRSAASAAWWTTLIWAILITISWLGIMAIMHIRPEWVLRMIGESVTWDDLGRIYLWFMGVFKTLLWLLFMGAIFLTIWAKKLHRAGTGG